MHDLFSLQLDGKFLTYFDEVVVDIDVFRFATVASNVVALKHFELSEEK